MGLGPNAVHRSTNWSRRPAGTQGIELVMWLAARGALGPPRCRPTLHANYHIPITQHRGRDLVMLMANLRRLA
jgi:hypothetical protein